MGILHYDLSAQWSIFTAWLLLLEVVLLFNRKRSVKIKTFHWTGQRVKLVPGELGCEAKLIFGDTNSNICRWLCEEALGQAAAHTEHSPRQSHRSFTHSWHAACWVAKADGDHVFVLTPEWLTTKSRNDRKYVIIATVVFIFSLALQMCMQAIKGARAVFIRPEAQ